MAASMQNSKKKLLNDLAAEEAKREDAVRQLQQMKEDVIQMGDKQLKVKQRLSFLKTRTNIAISKLSFDRA